MSDSERHQPLYDDIARLAYDRYLARGRAHGFALKDWLAAEQDARRRQRDRDGTWPHSATVASQVIM